MAFGLSIESVITVIDSKGKESDIKFNHPINVDIGALKNTVRSTVALIDALIRGQVIRAKIVLVVNLAGGLALKTSAILGADVEEGVRFNFEVLSGGKTVFRVPTLNETFLNSAGVLQVTGGGAVDDFIQRIISGQTVGLTNVSPSDAYGSSVATFLGGRESFTGSRGAA
jgi:hypothetical protein